MPNDVVIKIENLYKQYNLGTIGYGTLREDLQSWWAKVRGREDPNEKIDITGSAQGSDEKRFWALEDISFDVKQGERIGIVGRNGAGKSTLLKILSRVTAPTKGQVKVKGRVASMLEVGTGFHPELTGRENVYLNGAINGMPKTEIDRKFDEIVDFAGIAKFIDTPVKRYSSGMYVRLAFAVAAHLDPEILVVDEVLAVGDMQFQKKCLGKMEEAENAERTVLFVSHNMQSIRTLCARSLLLNEGKILYNGETNEVLNHYHQIMRDNKVDDKTSISNPRHRRGSGAVRFTDIRVQDVNGKEKFKFDMGDTIRFKLSYRIYKQIDELQVIVALRSGITNEIITSVQHPIPIETDNDDKQRSVIIEFPAINIRPGEYPLYFWLGTMGRKFDVVDNLTAPLLISVGNKFKDPNFDPMQPVGYFSVKSNYQLL